MKKVMIYKGVAALAIASGIVLATSPMVYAKSFDNNNCPQKPSFEQLQKQKSSHCYIDSKNIVHKGIPGPNDDAVFRMENFGSNLILNGQKILYDEEKVSKSMYHLYDGLNEDFGTSVMFKTYTEKDGIANLLQELLNKGYSLNDAVEFVANIDAHIYTGYGPDNFWYQSINSNTNDNNNNCNHDDRDKHDGDRNHDGHHHDNHHHDNDKPKQKIYR